jgi:hypothetical protein
MYWRETKGELSPKRINRRYFTLTTQPDVKSDQRQLDCTFVTAHFSRATRGAVGRRLQARTFGDLFLLFRLAKGATAIHAPGE